MFILNILRDNYEIQREVASENGALRTTPVLDNLHDRCAKQGDQSAY